MPTAAKAGFIWLTRMVPTTACWHRWTTPIIPLPRAGKDFVWSPDGSTIAFVSAVASSDPVMEADPIVITRYLYRPESGWPSRFNDNKRMHLFTVDVASGKVTQRTEGDRYEHSVDWSPDGKTLVFLQNPEQEQDKVYNYDIFTLHVRSGKIGRVTQTRGVEYAPVFSPDGRKLAFSGLMRPVTLSEMNMENPQAWAGPGQRRACRHRCRHR